MPLMTFEGFSVEAPPGWVDYTDPIDGEDAPIILGREDGIGALQFSIALYEEGELSDPSPDDLRELLRILADAQGLDGAGEIVTESVPLRLAAGNFSNAEDFMRIWQLSDGIHFALVTYTCELGMQGPEVEECEQIVRSLEFHPGIDPA